MARHRIAVIAVGMLAGIELHVTASVHLQANLPAMAHGFDRSYFAVGNLQVTCRCGELDAVAQGEAARFFPIDGYALLPARS